jgi:hypothetical protein
VAERNSVDLAQDPAAMIGTRILDAPRALVFQMWDRSQAPVAMVGSQRLHHHHQRLRHAAGWRVALRHARAGRARLREPHHLRGRSCRRSASSIGMAAADDVEPVQFRTTVTFEDLGGRTRLTLRGPVPVCRRARSGDPRVRRRHGAGADAGPSRPTIWPVRPEHYVAKRRSRDGEVRADTAERTRDHVDAHVRGAASTRVRRLHQAGDGQALAVGSAGVADGPLRDRPAGGRQAALRLAPQGEGRHGAKRRVPRDRGAGRGLSTPRSSTRTGPEAKPW